MESTEFIRRTKAVYDQVFDAFDNIDPDMAEADESADNIQITFANGTIFVLNRQRATSQIWLATKKSGYHFNYDPSVDQWICDKSKAEMFDLLAKEISAQLGHLFQF